MQLGHTTPNVHVHILLKHSVEELKSFQMKIQWVNYFSEKQMNKRFNPSNYFKDWLPDN